MNTSRSDTKELILDLAKPVNDGNYEAARRYVNDNISYVRPFGTHDGAEAYLDEMKRRHLKFDILKMFADRKRVCCCTTLRCPASRYLPAAGFRLSAGK